MLTGWGRKLPMVALGLMASGCASHQSQVGEHYMFVPSRPAAVAPAAAPPPLLAPAPLTPAPVTAQPLPAAENPKPAAAPLRLVPGAEGAR